jgi:sRNA-binding regulator protein Hfq
VLKLLLRTKNGKLSGLNRFYIYTKIDKFSGFCIPILLRNETSKEVTQIIYENIIKVFVPPKEISCDKLNFLGLKLENCWHSTT